MAPFETYTDPKTGEERERWVPARKGFGQAKPQQQAQPKPAPKPQQGVRDDGLLTTLVGAGASGIGAGYQELMRSGDVGKAFNAAQRASTGILERAQGAGGATARMMAAGVARTAQEASDTGTNIRAALSGNRVEPTTVDRPDAPFLGVLPPLKAPKQAPVERFATDIITMGVEMLGIQGLARKGVAMAAPRVAAAAPRLAAKASQVGLAVQNAKSAITATRAGAAAAKVGGWATGGAASSAVATGTLFDPHQGTLSDSIYPLVKDTPIGPVFDKLRVNPRDKGLEAQVRAAVNDAVWGVPFGMAFGVGGEVVRAAATSPVIKAAMAKMITKTIKAAAVADEAVTRGANPDLEPPVAAPAPEPPPVVRMTGRKKAAPEAPAAEPEPKAPVDDVAEAMEEVRVAKHELDTVVAKETMAAPPEFRAQEEQAGVPEFMRQPMTREIAEVPPAEIEARPDEFQFKMAGQTKSGASGSLTEAQEYNPLLEGIISAWRDVDGELGDPGRVYVVNGHNRLNLAKRSNAPTVLVRFLQAKTAREARAQGALQNIVEANNNIGTTTPLDAAKFMRDTGATPESMKQMGVDMRGSITQQAVPLSRLPDHIFQKVTTGDMPMAQALALGSDEAVSPDLISEVAAMAAKKRWSADKIVQAIQEAKFARSEVPADGSLPGMEEWAKESNLNQLLDIRTEAFKVLREQMVALRSAAMGSRQAILENAGNTIDVAGSKAAKDEAAQAVATFNRVTGYQGPVRDLLNELAGQVKGKRTAKAIVAENLDRLRQTIEEEMNGPRLPFDEAPAPDMPPTSPDMPPATEASAAPAPTPELQRQLFSPEDRAVMDKALASLPPEKRAEVIARLEAGEPMRNPAPIGGEPLVLDAPQAAARVEIPATASRKLAPNREQSYAESLYSWVNDGVPGNQQPVASADEALRLVRAKGRALDPDKVPGLDMEAARNDKSMGRVTEATKAVAAAYRQFYGVGEQLSVSLPEQLKIGAGMSDRTILSKLQKAELIEEIQRVAGPVDVSLRHQIDVRLSGDQAASYGLKKGMEVPVAGFYSPSDDIADSAITVAMYLRGLPRPLADQLKTGYHEAFHHLQRWFLTDNEIITLKGDLMLGADSGIRKLAAQAEPGMARLINNGSLQPSELEAVAFSGWSRFGDQYAKATWAEPMRKLYDIARATVNWLAGAGFQTWEDVFDRALSGEMLERGARDVPVDARMFDGAPEVQLAIEPPDLEAFAKEVDRNLTAIRDGSMSLADAMTNSIRRFASTTGNTVYQPEAPDEMIASSRALESFLTGRADITGIPSYRIKEVYQEAANWVASVDGDLDVILKTQAAAERGELDASQRLVAMAGMILKREGVAYQNGLAAIEFQRGDEAMRANAMQRLWAGMADQMRIDAALARATRQDAQRLRLMQGPDKMPMQTYINERTLAPGAILRHGTSMESGEAILKGGFEPSRTKQGLLGEGVYFTTKPTYSAAYGEAEVYGDLPPDVRILDLLEMGKSIRDFLKDIGLGKVQVDDFSSSITLEQKLKLRNWAAENGYDGIRYDADFRTSERNADEVIIFDPNQANRVVGSDAAVEPPMDPDLPDPRVSMEEEIRDEANDLLSKLPPEVREEIENGVLGPESEAFTETLTQAITSFKPGGPGGPGAATVFAKRLKDVPMGFLTQDLLLQAYRSSLLWTVKTWGKMFIGTIPRTISQGALMAAGATIEGVGNAVAGRGKQAARNMRQAQLGLQSYVKQMASIQHGLRLAWAAMVEGEAFGNVGVTSTEINQRMGGSAADQMTLMAMKEDGIRRTTLNEPFFIDPTDKDVLSTALKWAWRTLSFSGRVAGSIDTLFATINGSASEWARLVDLSYERAIDMGMAPGQAWNWAWDKADELLDQQWKDVVLEGGKAIRKAALTGVHAESAMNWSNYTNPIRTEFEPRSLEYGIQQAREEGLTNSADILRRAQEWMAEEPGRMQQVGMTVGRGLSFLPDKLNEAIKGAPLVGTVQAFLRTPYDLVRASLRAGPAAPLADTFWRDINSEDPFTRHKATGEVAMGSLAMLGVMQVATSGFVEFSGFGITDRSIREKARGVGYRPFAMRLKNPLTGWAGEWWDLSAVDAFSVMAASAGSWLDMQGRMPVEQRDAFAGNLALSAAAYIGQVGLSQFTRTTFQGLTQLADLVQEVQQGRALRMEGKEGGFEEYIQRKLKDFLPRIFKGIRNGVDPYERDVVASDLPFPWNNLHELAQRYAADIPGLSNQLPLILHPITARPLLVEQVVGTEAVPPEQPWLRGLVQAANPLAAVPYTVASNDVVDNELWKLSGKGTAFIVWQANELRIPQFRLDRSELNELAEITADYVSPQTGLTLHGALEKMIKSDRYWQMPEPEPSKATESARAYTLNRIIDDYKKPILARFLANHPDLEERVRAIESARKQTKLEAMAGGLEAWMQP